MKFSERLRAGWDAFNNKADLDADKELMELLGLDKGSNKKAINEATYFICLKILSETLGKMPLKFYQQTEKGRIKAKSDSMAYHLTVRPNRYMTPSTFWTTMEFNCNHHGNAYAWINTVYHRSGYSVLGIYPMQPDCVTVTIDDKGIFGGKGNVYYQYTDPQTGKEYVFKDDAVLHFKTWLTSDGLLGKSVRDILRDTVTGATSADTYMGNLYKNGMTATMALQYTGDLDKERQNALIKRYTSLMSGVKNIGKVVPVPVGMTLQPLNIKLADAQFYELKKYTALQIAAAFGVKPNHLNDYEKSSYANSEHQQISFLIDTMLYRLTQYEQEINYKCCTDQQIKDGYFYKFNDKVLLRTDSKTQMDIMRDGVQNAIYKPNEARGMIDLPWADGGDQLICNGNYIPISMVGEQYKKGGEGDK